MVRTGNAQGDNAGKLARGNRTKGGRYSDPQIRLCRKFVRIDRTRRRRRNRLGTGKISAREHHGCTQWRPYPWQCVKPENLPRQEGLGKGRGFRRRQRRWRRLLPLGVLSDAPTNTLWACEIYTTPPGSPPHSALRGFDLKTGAGKFRWELPGEKNLCNDFVVGPDKALYISDTIGAKIWRLKPGAAAAEMFSDDRTLFGIDGITFLGDSLYENNVIFNKLYRVPIDATGKAGKPVDIWMDKPVKGPDGMRAANGKLFLTENGAGKIDMVTVSGDTANISVLQEGLATPTAIEPAGDTLWYGERAGDRAHSMPLSK
jgi:hypothetical protein